MISSWHTVAPADFATTQHQALLCAHEILAPPGTPQRDLCSQHPTVYVHGWPEHERAVAPSEYAWHHTVHQVRLLDDATFQAYLDACAHSPAAYHLCSVARPAPAELLTDPAAAHPLAGWEVVVPRPAQQAAGMLTQLAAAGAAAWAVPTIQINLDKPEPQHDWSAYAWAVATSVNTVRACQQQFPQPPQGVRWAAVGAKTARALASWGAHVALEPPATAQTAQGLASVFPAPETEKAQLVWYPHADIAKPTLGRALRAQGWKLDECVAYRTTAAPGVPAGLVHRLADPAHHRMALCVTAGSTAEHFLALCGQPDPSLVVAAIGPRARRACEDLGLSVQVQPAESSATALVDALIGEVGARGVE